MLASAALAAAVLAFAPTASAQIIGEIDEADAASLTRTDPSRMAVNCWGYVEDDRLKYNCIGTRATQPVMEKFLPARGTECTGRVQGFSGSRKGLRVYCGGSGDAPDPPRGDYDYEIANVRRYIPSSRNADWLRFTVRALKAAPRYEIRVTFQQGAYRSVSTERFYDPEPGNQEDEMTIPRTDEQWSFGTISPLLGHRCRRCGRYTRTALPDGRALMPASADPTESPGVHRRDRDRFGWTALML